VRIHNIRPETFIRFLPQYLILLSGIFLLSYTAYRAAVLSFTHDESFTWNIYVNMPFMDIVSLVTPSANNHILNTLLMKLFSSLFGSSEFVLRLPNVISHAGFLFFSFLIIKKIKQPLLMLFCFIVLNFNPYLLDFFSLARGYGLSLGLMAAGLYFFIEYADLQKRSLLNLSFVFISFGVLANLSLILLFISLLIVANILFFLNNGQVKFSGFFKFNIPLFVYTVLLALFLYEPVRKLVKFNQLYFGGETGFWNDTVMSLVYSTLYRMHYTQIAVQSINRILLMLLITSFFILAYSLIKYKKGIIKEAFAVLFLIAVLFAGGSILQHYLAGTKFLVYRTALVFLPFMVMVPFFAFSYHCNKGFFSKIILLPAFLFALASVLNFSSAANTDYVLEWQHEADTRLMLSDIHELNKETDSAGKLTLGISWVFEPAVNFYIQTQNLNWLEPVDRGGVNRECDFYFVLPEHADSVLMNNKQLIKKYNRTGNMLYR